MNTSKPKSKPAAKASSKGEPVMRIADRAMRRAQRNAVAEDARFGLKPVVASSPKRQQTS